MTIQFDLPAELTIYSAIETRDALLTWATEQTAKSNSQLEISAAAVNEVDGSGLQLLAALSNMNLTWKLIETSSAFSEACRIMGFTDWLGNTHFQASNAGQKS
jgi:ABC-type transporter Mla MlaB component